jgi:hypothetical protein
MLPPSCDQAASNYRMPVAVWPREPNSERSDLLQSKLVAGVALWREWRFHVQRLADKAQPIKFCPPARQCRTLCHESVSSGPGQTRTAATWPAWQAAADPGYRDLCKSQALRLGGPLTGILPGASWNRSSLIGREPLPAAAAPWGWSTGWCHPL